MTLNQGLQMENTLKWLDTKNISNRIYFIIIFLIINHNTGISQIMTLDSFLTIAKNEGYNKLNHSYQPEYLYYFNRQAAIDLACIQLEQSINKTLVNYDNEPTEAVYLAEECEPDEKLCKALFNFYLKNIESLTNNASSDYAKFSKIVYLPDKLMCSLLHQMPKGFKDTLMSHMIILQKILLKIHPKNYSFFDNVWDFLSNGFWSHKNYDYGNCMFKIIGQTLDNLGEKKIVDSLYSDIDTSSIKFLKYYNLKCYKTNKYYKNTGSCFVDHIVNLKEKSKTINDLMKSDKNTIIDLTFNNAVDLKISKLILVNGKESLFWCTPYFDGIKIGTYGWGSTTLVKFELLDEYCVKVSYLTSYVN